MTNLTVTSNQDAKSILIPGDANRDEKSRLGAFVDWLTLTGRQWHTPDLAQYRDYLLHERTDDQGKDKTLAPAAVSAHLSTIRARYQKLLRDSAIRQEQFDQAGALLRQTGNDTPSDRKAIVDEFERRLRDALNPEDSKVETVTRQDRPDSDHLRLTREQAESLLCAPGLSYPEGLRNTAIIALALCTGIREQELCDLEVDDLRQRLGGELALHIRQGKGCKERLIPYGELSWCLALVDKWLACAHITSGPVFRGFYKGGRVRDTKLTTMSIERILEQYPVCVDGKLVHVRPHDLRRTYGRRLYESGLDLVAIQQNLGHGSLKTTLAYIGALGADKRRAPAVYSFDLGKLNAIPEQTVLTE